MIVTGAWWDYVDQLAGKHMGHLLATHPEDIRPVLLRWAGDDDIWRRRTAILAQLRFKDRTDPGLLFAVIEPSIARKEFFLRKAIGWALREYSKTRPDAVTRYVEANATGSPPQQARGHEGAGTPLVDRGWSALRRRALDRHRRLWLRPASSTYPAGTPSSAVLATDAAAGATSHRRHPDQPRDPRLLSNAHSVNTP